MTFIFWCSLVGAALAFSGTQAHAQDANADIYGTWKVKALLGGGIGSRSQKQVDKVIGKVAVIGPNRLDFDGHTCAPRHYQRSKEETGKHFDREWRADVSDIPLPNPVTIIDTGCMVTLYPLHKNHLMIADSGDFFEAVRIRHPARTPLRQNRP